MKTCVDVELIQTTQFNAFQFIPELIWRGALLPVTACCWQGTRPRRDAMILFSSLHALKYQTRYKEIQSDSFLALNLPHRQPVAFFSVSHSFHPSPWAACFCFFWPCWPVLPLRRYPPDLHSPTAASHRSCRVRFCLLETCHLDDHSPTRYHLLPVSPLTPHALEVIYVHSVLIHHRIPIPTHFFSLFFFLLLLDLCS